MYEIFKEKLKSHAKWLNGEPDGVRLKYHGDLTGVNLSGADLRHANLYGSDLKYADLSGARLDGANLSNTCLIRTNMVGITGDHINFTYANLSEADMRESNLEYPDMSNSDISVLNMENSIVGRPHWNKAVAKVLPNISGVEFYGSTSGINDSILNRYRENTTLEKYNFERCPEGIIVYKAFGAAVTQYLDEGLSPYPGAVLHTADCSMNGFRTISYGINVGTYEWARNTVADTVAIGKPPVPIWRCLIRHEWLDGICLPFTSNDVIRTNKLEVIGVVNVETEFTPSHDLNISLYMHRLWVHSGGRIGLKFEYHGDMSNLYISDLDFRRSDLSGCDFTGCEITRCNFTSCNLTGCDFTNAKLNDCSFNKAKLRDVCMDHANLCNISMDRATLFNVTFDHTIGSNVTILFSRLSHVTFDHVTGVKIDSCRKMYDCIFRDVDFRYGGMSIDDSSADSIIIKKCRT